VKAPMLKLPNFDKDFDIHSNVFDFAIIRTLAQDGKLVVFENRS
jgi:hypothetical protein